MDTKTTIKAIREALTDIEDDLEEPEFLLAEDIASRERDIKKIWDILTK